MHSTHGSLLGTPATARPSRFGPSAVGPHAARAAVDDAELSRDMQAAELGCSEPEQATAAVELVAHERSPALARCSPIARRAILFALVAVAYAALGPAAIWVPSRAYAQVAQAQTEAPESAEPQSADRALATPGSSPEQADQTADQLARLAADAEANRQAQADAAAAERPREMNFFQLLMDGGPLMIPLVLISILVLAVSLERLINLRMSRILPRKLRRGLIEASEQRFPVDPQELYQIGLRYPSVASRVLESMLKKVGRPVPEMEAALQDACQREAERLYGTVRWLTAAAAIAPLLGLLGTVWGMILAFFETTQPGMGINRTQQLAQGISIAFVNTLAGLSIAIPAAGFSHFFEGRIVKAMGILQELIQTLIPRLERFEGVTRYDLELVGLVPRRRSEGQPPNMPTSPAPSLPADTIPLDGDNGVRPRDIPRAPTASLPRSTRGR